MTNPISKYSSVSLILLRTCLFENYIRLIAWAERALHGRRLADENQFRKFGWRTKRGASDEGGQGGLWEQVER